MNEAFQNTHSPKNKLFISDLDGRLFPIDWAQSEEEQLVSDDDYKFLVKTLFKFTDMKCTPLLIHLIRYLTNEFINGNYDLFITEIIDGILYYRFSNDGNLCVTISPLGEPACFLVSLSAGIELN